MIHIRSKLKKKKLFFVHHPYNQRVFPVSEVIVARHCNRKACPHRSEKLMMLLRTGEEVSGPWLQSEVTPKSQQHTHINLTCTEQMESTGDSSTLVFGPSIQLGLPTRKRLEPTVMMYPSVIPYTRTRTTESERAKFTVSADIKQTVRHSDAAIP